ncbi:response regulator [Serratia marcescens]|uniref:response regulator n=1 Tax=Serratia marcescens TaxID=615 RepID=UPI0018D6FA39|nr:response regulator [Serratia marcescens]MBH3056430.1 response regulator [Serratia marcescens]
MPRVLCVDDNTDTLQNIIDIISEWDDSPYGEFEVVGESIFENAVKRLKNERFDLVTLDLHGSSDPDPIKDNGEQEEQEGKRVLNALRGIRFIPVVFYTGYADKIKSLESGVVKVVKKGDNDLVNIRKSIDSLYSTGISNLISFIEEENRKYIWDTLDKSWTDMAKENASEDFAYLLARRLGARLSRESIKEHLNHDPEKIRPVEMYIYPAHLEKIKTGCILKEKDGSFWVVATPACDFAQSKVESVLLIGTTILEQSTEYHEWAAEKWDGKGDAPSKGASRKYNKLRSILVNNAGDRFRFLPKTFYIDNLIVDFQRLKQVPIEDADGFNVICRIDSPFREELLIQLSRYYGRMGVPDLNISEFISCL